MSKKREDTKDWILMHKNIPIANVELVEEEGVISKINDTLNTEHAPLGTLNNNKLDRKKLNGWFKDRSIPASRQNIKQILDDLNFSTPQSLAVQSYGLSLSDHYWIKPSQKNISWEDVNFYQNKFSNDIGEIMFLNRSSNAPNINIHSPDNSSDGWLKKRWIQQDNKQLLIKGGSGYFEQEPYNEEIASNLMKHLGIKHTSYKQIFMKDKAYSVCENFTNEHTEYITASRLYDSEKKANHHSNYQHLLNCCEKVGITHITGHLDQMLVIDYIIANTDRHWSNFGFIRNADTLEYQGFAPLFDNGTSLWHDKHQATGDVDTLTFPGPHAKQIKLVKDLSWFEPLATSQISEIITHSLRKHPFMDEKRINMISEAVIKKSEFITNLKRDLSPAIFAVKKFK